MDSEMSMRIVLHRQYDDPHHNNDGVMVVHKRLFWNHSNEIVWEELTNTGRHRIAMYGIASDNQVPIMILSLPEETLPPPVSPPMQQPMESVNNNSNNHVMAICTIEQQAVLACLIAPDSIIAFTLERSTTLFPPEGWQINLPFDCVAIFGSSKGLILQRAIDEQEEYNHPSSFFNNTNNTDTNYQNNNTNNNAVLFSWHHPLQEMLPILTETPPQSLVWVGDIQDDTYMVTFRNQAHAIYRIRHAPILPETPLHVQIPIRYEIKQTDSATRQHAWGDETDTDLTLLQNNYDDVDMMDDDLFWNTSTQKINHEQALAEALLGNTPAAARQKQYQRSGHLMMRNNSNINPQQNNNPFHSHNKRSSEHSANFWSPSPTNSHHLMATTSCSNHQYHHLSKSLMPRLQIELVCNIPIHTEQPLLHVFATSKAIGLLVPMTMKHSSKSSNQLLLWQPKTTAKMTASNTKTNHSNLSALTTPNTVANSSSQYDSIENVRMAQPIDVIPGKGNGILVWHDDRSLKLYRDDVVTWPVVQGDLDRPERDVQIQYFETCRDRIRFNTILSGKDRTVCTGRLTLTMQDGMTESILTACDAALDYDIGAWKLRASVQIMGGDWNAFRGVIWNILYFETRDWDTAGKTLPQQATKDTSQSTAWEELMDSEYHQHYGKMLWDSKNELNSASTKRCFCPEPTTSLPVVEYVNRAAKDRPIFSILFDAMHFYYEDTKLSLHSNFRGHLGQFLADLCQFLMDYNENARVFLNYYQNDTGSGESFGSKPVARPSFLQEAFLFSSFQNPPSILWWMERTMQRASDNSMKTDELTPFDIPRTINAACAKTLSMVHIFSILFDQSRSSDSDRDRDVVLAMVEHGFSSSQVITQDCPPGVALPLLEVIHRCRNSPTLLNLEKSGWTAESLELVGRQDLSRNLNPGGNNDAQDKYIVPPRVPVSTYGSGNLSELDEDKDGLVPLEHSAVFLFPNDNRVHEAVRLLRSSRPMFLRVERALEISDHEYEKKKQKRLMELSIRSLALPIGRGMLTIGNLHPIPAEIFPLPELCLKGRVPPTNGTMRLDISECAPDMPVWPEFHNGVAAGLRLPLHSEKDRLGYNITRTWILYNRPPDKCESETQGDERPAHVKQAYLHGGFLMGLGLRGHLTALEMSDFYEYLTQGTVTTTVGVLLGLAANRRGSCDISVSKMLCLHIPSLIPQHFSAIDVASTVQTAAIVGAGLLYQRSSHRMMTEFLLNEIGKRPDTDMSTFEREAYTLACGLALGTVNLCLGEKNNGDIDRAAGLADLHMEERLLRYIIGGVDGDEARRTRETHDRFSLPTSMNSNDSERCSTVWEGDFVNTGVTCPGATLALGMLYMKTENKTISSALALPNTHFLLEFIRPDFLGLRVISRSLILWNEVQPTQHWVHDQIPSVVQDAYHQMRSMAKVAHGIKSPTSRLQPRSKQSFDRRAVRQMYAHIVAGSCFSIGLRFAGTGNIEAKHTLIHFVKDFHVLKEASNPVSVASKPEMTILDNCLGTIAISLSLVLAGSCDLDALRWLKILRWRCDRDTKYGTHMIYGMAIGILFLGGGTCTIGREPEDIAALLTAFFPRYPMSTTDNQFHLQALRHLYALSVKRRELQAIDIDTGGSASVQVEITTDGFPPDNLYKLNVPCLLHNSESSWKELRIVSDGFFPLRIHMKQIENNGLTFFVKKCSSMLKESHRHLLLVTGKNGDIVPQSTSQLVQSSTSRPLWNGLAGFLCANEDEMQFLSRALLYCLNADSEDAFLSLYLPLWNSVRRVSCRKSTCDEMVRTMRLIRVYYQRAHPRILACINDPSCPSILPPNLLDSELLFPYLQECMERRLQSPVFSATEETQVL